MKVKRKNLTAKDKINILDHMFQNQLETNKKLSICARRSRDLTRENQRLKAELRDVKSIIDKSFNRCQLSDGDEEEEVYVPSN